MSIKINILVGMLVAYTNPTDFASWKEDRKQERATTKRETMNKEDKSDDSFEYKSDSEGKTKKKECQKKSVKDVSVDRHYSSSK